MKKARILVGLIATLSCTGMAQAQEEAPEGEAEEFPEVTEPVEEEAAAQESEAAPAQAQGEEPADEEDGGSGHSSKAGDDGMRFRFGVAGGAGPIFLSYKPTSEKATATYGGVDLRFGLQINDMIGVYLQPQMGVYAIGGNGFLGTGGLIGASVGADATFMNRLFVGGGLGYAILNNPSGLEVHLRAGGYPIMARSSKKVRRKGLMVGLDFRVHLISQDGAKFTGIAPTFNIGYEAF